MWIKMDNPNSCRNTTFKMLLDINTGNKIYIFERAGQKDDDLSLTVWGDYPTGTHSLYEGTEVECRRIIEKISSKLNVSELNPWE